ncbi:MAG: PilN domain-containing protein, partial [Gammaproteobacteria bacterium]|nr:PilN domain-containing protein [Gammaproteobacteria bacterium]
KTFRQSGENLTINGVADSAARVSAYMRNIDESEWLGSPGLGVIQARTDGRMRTREFTLSAKQVREQQPNEGG